MIRTVATSFEIPYLRFETLPSGRNINGSVTFSHSEKPLLKLIPFANKKIILNSVELKIGLFTVTSFYYLFYHFDYCLRTKITIILKYFVSIQKIP